MRRTVRSRVLPPAPYVIEMKLGDTFSRRRIASQSCSAAASSFGGKNSKLKVGVGASIIATRDRVKRSARVIEEAVPCAMPTP